MRAALLALALAVVLPTTAGAAPPPANPFTGPTGTSAMHGDSLASDTSPLPGPGTTGLATTHVALGAACPSILSGTDRMPVALCTAPGGTAVATDHALYLLRAGPRIVWRRDYERGSARKPGQLSRGTGSTPTFFGPRTGWEYLTVVDNADGTEHLRVWGSRRGRPACDVPVTIGSENSPIGAGRTVIVASTYGYPYPATPDDAGPAVPATAPFTGGMTRVGTTADDTLQLAGTPGPGGVLWQGTITGLLRIAGS